MGEDAAAAFLRQKGYKVLDRNWRGSRGELDLVCESGQILVFVEVKTRTPGPMNKPWQGMTPAKKSTLMRTVSEYLTRTGLWERPCRLDLVAVEVAEGAEPVVEHVQNVDAPNPGAGGWQPW